MFRNLLSILFLFLQFHFFATAQEITWVPVGATLTEQGNSLTIKVPPKWSYWGLNASNKPFEATEGKDITISCDCTGTGGQCMPFYAQGPGGTTSGCAGQCNKCSLTKTGWSLERIISGGFVCIEKGVMFAIVGEELPPAFDEMLLIPSIKKDLENFKNRFYPNISIPNVNENNGTFTAPDGFKIAILNVYGRGMMVVIPNNIEGSNGTGSSSCACSGGSCIAHKREVWGLGEACWCEGNCSGVCTLTVH